LQLFLYVKQCSTGQKGQQVALITARKQLKSTESGRQFLQLIIMLSLKNEDRLELVNGLHSLEGPW